MPTLDATTGELNKRINFWNKIYRISLLILVAIAIGIQIQSNARTLQIVEEVKKTQDAQQASTLEAREANKARQKNLEDYFKCLALLRFEEKPENLKTKQGVVKALDKCASKN